MANVASVEDDKKKYEQGIQQKEGRHTEEVVVGCEAAAFGV